jgi:uncharacterized repeat protein (TIGR01451 family)
MFKKIVSNLPFTPSLLPQISFYAKRLTQESATRKLGIVFAGLTIILQSVLFISPPQPSLASSNNDVIFGGLSGSESEAKQQLINYVYRGDNAMVSPYNKKTYYDLDVLFQHFNITEKDIQNSEKVTICSQCNEQDKRKRSVGRLPNSVDATKDVKFTPADSRYSYYLRPLYIWDSGSHSKYEALKIRDGVWILLNCGNIVVDDVPDANLELTKTQSPRNGAVVAPGSTVTYGFTLKNTGNATAQNVKILDSFPSTSIFSSIQVNKDQAKTVSDKVTINGKTYTRWTFGNVPAGQTLKVSMTARLNAGDAREVCNTGSVEFENAEGNSRKVNSNRVCFDREEPPEPTFSCKSLQNQISLTGITPITTRFNTNYELTGGAQFEGVVYFVNGDRAGQSDSANFAHTFDEPGDYRIHAVVQTSEGSTPKTELCAQTVTVNPPAASYTCRQLAVDGDVIGTESLITAFVADYELANTNLVELRFFVDGELMSTQTDNIYEHTFDTLGAHTASVIVVTDDGATEQTEDCSATVNVEETPDNSIEEDKTARVITGINPVSTDDSDKRSASVDGRTVTSGELIEYELSIINSGNASYDDNNPYQPPSENLVDVLEYANVIGRDGNEVTDLSRYDEPVELFGGGVLDGGEVTWPAIIAFDPGSSIKKSIFVKIKDTIPKTNTPPSDPFSYDCTMSNTYINSSTVNINVECPPEKIVESSISALPSTGPLQTALTTGSFALLAFYLFSRNQLLIKELQLVQTEFSGGPLR